MAIKFNIEGEPRRSFAMAHCIVSKLTAKGWGI